jgi:hypothetical protein
VINSTHQGKTASIHSAVDNKPDCSQLDLNSAEEVEPTSVEVQSGQRVSSGGGKVSVSLAPQSDLAVLVEREVHRE